MPQLRKKHRKILYNALVDSLEKQIPDKWERKMFRKMVNNTVIRSVEDIKSRKEGWETKGENVQHVYIGPRGRRYIGQVEIYVPEKTLEQLKGLKSRDTAKREVAEEALHTVAHEYAHNYFKAINYEARMTRFYRDHPEAVEKVLGGFVSKTSRQPSAEVRENIRKAVNKNPLFWANYVAHTAHEAGADIMGTRTAIELAEGRTARARDLERFTAFRPFTIREYIKLRYGGRIPGIQRPKKPSRLEELAKNIEYASAEFMNKMGGLNRVAHPSWEYAPRKREVVHARR